MKKNRLPQNCKTCGETFEIRNVIVEWAGKRLTLKEWAGERGVKYSTLWWRYKNGWDIDRMLSQ